MRYSKDKLLALRQECATTNKHCSRCTLKTECDALDNTQRRIFEGRCPTPKVWTDYMINLLSLPLLNSEEKYEQ